MLLVMQVMTASAVTVTGVGVGYHVDAVAARWTLSHYDLYMTAGNYQYQASGKSINSTPMDSGEVELVILRDSSTNAIVEYEYDEELISFSENYVRTGDGAQTGESICHVTLTDNFFGTIVQTINNY
jgi:hypothetical protein